jgi:hypothetical protein
MKQHHPTMNDKMRATVELYLAHGEGIIAKSTYQMLRGAFRTRNIERLEMALSRAKKHDADIRAIAEAEAMLSKANEQEELMATCSQLGDTLRNYRGEVSYELEQDRQWKLIELPQLLEAYDFDAMTEWLEQAGMILLAIDDHNQPSAIAQRMRNKLTVGAELICPAKQEAFRAWLDRLENLLMLDDRVELLVWINKARDHMRCLELRSKEGIPNTVGEPRRRQLEQAQLAFATA